MPMRCMGYTTPADMLSNLPEQPCQAISLRSHAEQHSQELLTEWRRQAALPSNLAEQPYLAIVS